MVLFAVNFIYVLGMRLGLSAEYSRIPWKERIIIYLQGFLKQ